MITLQFKCTLLSDVILNKKAATTGPNSTLDFIPGNCFLGIAANELYAKESPETCLTLFHSGKVRFGDAHPAHGNVRTLKVPADMFYPKLSSPSKKCYIMHKTDGSDYNIKAQQLKQCRTGYYDFTQEQAVCVQTNTNFAIKSAHDRNNRTSANKQMYGYESLAQGLVTFFDVEVDDDSLAEMIFRSLVGTKHIGRSRSSQYGLVEIEEYKYESVCSGKQCGEEITIYADSRLIFLDDEGNAVFSFKKDDTERFNIDGGEIVWEKSQIRTFQYAPWNSKRQCFDTDRCGIEKGSVIIVKGGKCPECSQYIGSYNNEGFGKVIYNPSFLKAEKDGMAKYTLAEMEKKPKPTPKDINANTALLKFLVSRKCEENTINNIYAEVDKWIKDNGGRFANDKFGSQWGIIRRMALKNDSGLDRIDNQIESFISKGVSAAKWKKRDRKDKLIEFINLFNDETTRRMALVNLASEMAKKTRKEDMK